MDAPRWLLWYRTIIGMWHWAGNVECKTDEYWEAPIQNKHAALADAPKPLCEKCLTRIIADKLVHGRPVPDLPRVRYVKDQKGELRRIDDTRDYL